MKYLHTMVRVTDLDRSLEFYCTHLGLENMGRFDIEEGRRRLGRVSRLGAVVNVERFIALILFVMSIDKVECVVHQQGTCCFGGPVIHRLILVVRVRCDCGVKMDKVFLAIVPATEAIIAKEGSRFCLNSAW